MKELEIKRLKLEKWDWKMPSNIWWDFNFKNLLYFII